MPLSGTLFAGLIPRCGPGVSLNEQTRERVVLFAGFADGYRTDTGVTAGFERSEIEHCSFAARLGPEWPMRLRRSREQRSLGAEP